IYSGIDVDLVDEEQASVVVCSGLVNDATDTPADYADLLCLFRKRNLPMICANPDIQIHRGNKLEWCAGALAQAYEELGGQTLIAGKPYRPIYEAAQSEAEIVLGRRLARSRILGIGDGLFTDVKGAADYGLDVLFISE
ncbi:HAD hydrolase-like protein, partial [Bacillus sp. IG2]|uniref:HAD hydrolase-like protein n=1 Tax=Bacillus sp. IG2 TaxID=3075931 RepID=UPI0028FBF5B9